MLEVPKSDLCLKKIIEHGTLLKLMRNVAETAINSQQAKLTLLCDRINRNLFSNCCNSCHIIFR